VVGRDPFLLDPDVVYLNHGAFGSCPKPVFDAYQSWQRELEREPIDFFDRRLADELARVRSALGEYIRASADDLALVLNATTALNTVLRSLSLEPGDEILTTDHDLPRPASTPRRSRIACGTSSGSRRRCEAGTGRS
jgi:isopenicillin-N epimerase